MELELNNYRMLWLVKYRKKKQWCPTSDVKFTRKNSSAVHSTTQILRSLLQRQNPVRKHELRGNVALTAASGMFTCSTSRPAQFYTQASIHHIPMTKKKVLNSETALPLVLTSTGFFETVNIFTSLSESQESCDCPLRTQKSAETLISLNKLTSA